MRWFGACFFDLPCCRCFFKCPHCVSFDSGKCLLIDCSVRPGHVEKFPDLTAAIHVSLVGYPAAACKYRMLFFMAGKVYTLFASPDPCSLGADPLMLSLSFISHSPDLLRHPWRTGVDALISTLSCTVTPSSCG